MLSESIFKKIDEVIAEQNKDYRGHLGFSIIGDTDERKLWLKFNWCLTSSFEGRMLRLFDLGNRIEDQVIDNISDTKVIEPVPLVDTSPDPVMDLSGKYYLISLILYFSWK